MAAPSPYAFLRNCRAYVSQRIEPRPGMLLVNATPFDQLLTHSLKRLNDDIAGTFARICGAGTKLYLNPGAAALDTGYSGNPLSMIPFRPERSPQPWLYVVDGNKLRKVRADGLVHNIGIAPPLLAPTAALGSPAYQIIDDFEAVGAWTVAGTAGAITTPNRISTTINRILYDSGNTGWACMESVATSDSIRPGMLLIVNSGGGTQETVLVDDVIQPLAATTISSINYDSGNTGPCTITPTIASVVTDILGHPTAEELHPELFRGQTGVFNAILREQARQEAAQTVIVVGHQTNYPLGLQMNALIRLNSGGGTDEVVRILSVSVGPNGLASFRCVCANNHIAGEALAGITTIRTFFANNHIATETLASKCFQSTMTVGTGYFNLAAAFNLTTATGRSIQQDDELHISFRIDHPEYLTEARIMLDVDSATNDFSKNFFFKAIRVSDLTAAINLGQTMLTASQVSIPRTTIDKVSKGQSIEFNVSPDDGGNGGGGAIPGGTGVIPTSGQATTGATQWSEITFKVKDLTRVGPDTSRGLGNVAALRIQFAVTNTAIINVDAFWIGGSYGPDIGELGSDYIYRFRGRSKITGAKGNASPPMRSGVQPIRQRVVVTLTQHPASDVDTLDVFRFGGSIPSWKYVGSVANSASPIFNDDYQDLEIANAPDLEVDNFQPFPTIDTPKNGTVNMSGTTVTWASGDKFNTSWSPGTQININGIYYTLYAQPTSNTRLEVVQSGGTQTGSTFFIYQATILGQPLPVMWGPYSEGTAAFMFSCGDTLQPGVLFLTKGNDPDSAPDTLQIEVTSPSEPLMNGVIYDGTPYVWTSQRLFRLYPTIGSGANLFVARSVQNTKGLFARWFLVRDDECPVLCWGADDGIYESSGGEGVSITADELYLLFPHDGQPGTPITLGSTTIYPPDFTQTASLRLSYSDGHIFFDFVDINGLRRSLVYNRTMKVWSVDDYSPSVAVHYAEEGRGVHSLLLGATDGKVYQASGAVDGNGNSFPMEIRMPQMSELVGGFIHGRDGFIGLISNGIVQLVENVDGTNLSPVNIPTTAAAYRRLYTPLVASKGRLFAFSLISDVPFSLFQRDCEFRFGNWGREGGYAPLNPFGSLMRPATTKVN